MTRKQMIADSFNTMYQWVVNGDQSRVDDEKAFKSARNFVGSDYSKLDLAVMEFLAYYMLTNPEGKIEFVESKTAVVDLLCKEIDQIRHLSFNYDGVIVKDEKVALNQKGE